MGTPVRCLSQALRCLSVPRGLGRSGDPIGLNSEYSRRGDMFQYERAADIGDGTGAMTGGVSGVRQRTVRVAPGHCCELVQDGVTQTMRGPLSRRRSPVAWNV
ncbi:hypothetical protein TIFTF001_008886 [Ficus carica]|uniref:Uncharacterized protein n=1 Tax=Ficus carica TaxID=3494 RepID=A0AA88A9H5_FICCA|nr:hypothetical protein TIFTF001_008886 [Ficus carica]